ncbi:DUF3857 and transglutaminase domain-containing protein [Occallatibacter riparius]|uniref:DUF3857 and transglutaminase domain-containing protein n=1 Tax=Occallatibacter riparius TaxID=1002689 RepID=A0A9J7BSM0_9BACT|nr:DUF3857 and transglutaminase domain-containing protein [Occallatibacter riparius]UWZ85599.1 DUF3857 and transglutaminase domain-containing protein [Occallatibacter riparius]
MRFHPAACFSLALLGTSLTVAAHAQFAPPTPEELKMTSDPKAPGADAVYLDRVEVTDDPHHFSTVYARIKVLTEKGTEAATVHIPYLKNFVFHASGDNSSRMGSGTANHWDAPNVNHSGEDRPNDIDSFDVKTDIAAIEGRTIHPDGTIVPLTGTPSDLLKIKRGKNQVNEVTFTLPSVEVGSIIEYRYQVRYDRFEGAVDWQIQKPFFTHHARFTFTPDEQFSPFRNKLGAAGVQNSSLLDYHSEIMTDLENAAILPAHATVKSEASGLYSLDLTDIPAAPLEPFSPPLEGRAYRVAFYYVATPDEKEFWRKDMSYWNKKLNQYIEPTNLLKSTVKEAVTGVDNDLDKAKKLYDITAKIENTDFSTTGEPGLGSGWIPAGSVERVLIDKKGASNQIAYLYLALARIAGLNPRPERIASRSQRIFSPQFRDPSQLDSVVITMNLGDKEVTVDPGAKMAPFATLHWAHSAAGGLVMNGSKIETVITPEQSITENAVIHIGNLAVTAQGSVSGSLKTAYIGQQALYLRQIAVSNGPDAARDEINRRLATQVPEGVQAKVDHLVNVDDPNKQLLAIVSVSGKPASQAGSRLVLPRNFFRAREANPYPADDSRISPVDVHYPEQEQDQITYVLPAGFSLEGKPEDASAKLEQDAAYQSKAKIEGNSVTSTRVLARGFTWLAPVQYTPLRDFYQKVVTADRQDLVLAPGTQATNQ